MDDSQITLALTQQFLVQGNPNLATEIANSMEVIDVPKDNVLFQEGDIGNDLFFILQGKFGVYLQGELISTREAGLHLGEMAMVDPGTTRSATIMALEDSVVGKLSQESFTDLANLNPSLWRGLSIELARRIRLLNEYISGQEPEPEMPELEDQLEDK